MEKNYKTKSGLFVLVFCALIKLSAQQSWTFTPCGATGAAGPTQTQANNTYSGGNLNGSVTISGQGIQQFTVPSTGMYIIETRGARGYNPSGFGGRGAIMKGEFNLTAGSVLKIVVGQEGQINPAAGTLQFGGGGGSFVALLNNTPLIVAGGGGGSHATSYAAGSADGTVSTTGNTSVGSSTALGGTGGAGGVAVASANGGAGFYGDGGGTTGPALSFTNGAMGGNVGAVAYANGGIGGFGGGGGTQSWNNNRGGGGGGYSGGGGASLGQPSLWAGGGGSYNNGANQVNVSGANTFSDGLVVITEGCNITLYAAGNTSSLNPLICAGQSATLMTNAISNYVWSTGANTSSLVVAPGTTSVYALTATSPSNCTAGKSITVTVNSTVPSLSISNPSNNICLGRTVTLTASGAVTYAWSGGVTNGVPFAPSATTNYTVIGANGCGTTAATTTITVTPLPVSITGPTAAICEGSTTTLTASSAVNGYTWSPISSTNIIIFVNPSVTTVYTVLASDGTCSGVADYTINTKTTPTIIAQGTSTRICQNYTMALNASGAQSYVWTPGNIPGQTIVVTPTANTLYEVTGTNSVGCTAMASWVMLVDLAPNINAVTNKPMVCVGGQAILSASGGTSYVWAGGPSTGNYTVNPNVPSVYSVTGTGTNSCTMDKTVAVNVFDPKVTVTTDKTTICHGDGANLTASGAGFNYSWSNGASGVYITVTPTVPSTYVASATTVSNGIVCPATGSVSIALHPVPSMSISATKTTLCRGDAPAVLTALGGTVYLWSTGSTSTVVNVPNFAVFNHTYNVTGRDVNGCQGTSANKVIQVIECVGIAEQSGNERITVYPNPNNGIFTIISPNNQQLKLINGLGQEIMKLNVAAGEENTVQMNDLPAGLYFIIGEKDRTISYKIIVL